LIGKRGERVAGFAVVGGLDLEDGAEVEGKQWARLRRKSRGGKIHAKEAGAEMISEQNASSNDTTARRVISL
jgi:hypothetical protein